ncbi:PX-associated-domain-containing protein [Phyllosticta capitalensis]
MSSPQLSPAQAHALFDILTHQETYSEIELFKDPQAIHKYGYPFPKEQGQLCVAPIMHTLFSKFMLSFPGLCDVPVEFWSDRILSIMEKLAAGDLSESYDKGAIGLRKTMSTASSAILEYPAKGILGGYPKKEVNTNRVYDMSQAADIMQGWEDFSQELIYGDMMDTLFDKVAETDDLTQHPVLIQVAHEYILVNLASLVHHILIVNPEGQTLMRMLDNIHRLIPYAIMRQTLKIGNVATMINGMLKIILAKVSIGSITNWAGLSKGADEGMNLMQQIISTVLSWDSSELEKRATKIEKAKDSPSKEHLKVLKAHIELDRSEHDRRRNISKKTSKSLVTVIFQENGLSTDMSDAQHEMCQTYLASKLAIRDRVQIAQTLCRSNPDYLTQAVRDLVPAYEPIIRSLHNAVDLSGSMLDLQNFLDDLIKLAKLPVKKEKRDKAEPPTVEDFVGLMRKHQYSLHKFLHQVAHNGVDIRERYRMYAHEIRDLFQQPEGAHEGAGAMTPTLEKILASLSEGDRQTVLRAVDSHSSYLSGLQAASTERMKSILSRGHRTDHGPGQYLAKWQHLMDSAVIQPATPNGPLRSGKSKDVKEASQMDVDGVYRGSVIVGKEAEGRQKLPDPPNVDVVYGLMGSQYREALAAGK